MMRFENLFSFFLEKKRVAAAVDHAARLFAVSTPPSALLSLAPERWIRHSRASNDDVVLWRDSRERQHAERGSER